MESCCPGKVKLALCQMPVTDDKAENIKTAMSYIEDAASRSADVVVLPEMWNCPYSNASFPEYAEEPDGADRAPSYEALQAAAEGDGVIVVGGSIPERCQGKLYNTCYVFDHDGTLLGRHRKVHLFDIDIPGKVTFKESATLSPGDAITTLHTRLGTIGVGICYDLRFPEYAAVATARGARLLVYPGAFNMTTGPAHWALLQQARALDNQVFVCTCSPARDEGASYVAWGHSMAVGPYGQVLGSLESEADILLVEIDLEEVEGRRQAIPVAQQKRVDLYELVDKHQGDTSACVQRVPGGHA